MVLSPVDRLVVLPELEPAGVVVTGDVIVVPATVLLGQARPHMANVEMSVVVPVVGTPVQAARANADKIKADADPIRMIFPTTQIIHR